MTARGDVVWVAFGSPRGSEPAKRRPAVVVQGDWLNASAIASQVGPVGREFVDPSAVGSVPSFMMRAIGDGVRLALGV